MPITAIDRSELIEGLEDLGFVEAAIVEAPDVLAFDLDSLDGYFARVREASAPSKTAVADEWLIQRFAVDERLIEEKRADSIEGVLALARDFKELLSH